MTAERIGTTAELEVNKAHRVACRASPSSSSRMPRASYAIGDTCTTATSPPEGFVEDDAIECWAHGSMFSLTTGKPSRSPPTNQFLSTP